MITAIKVRELRQFDSLVSSAEQKLWKLSERVKYSNEWDEVEKYTEFVVTFAAAVLFSGPETYIFAADENGEILSWSEMDGSFRGDLNHEQAIKNAGWIVARKE